MRDLTLLNGLNVIEVEKYKKEFGKNEIDLREDKMIHAIAKIIGTEPMLLLLLSCCIIYYSVQQPKEGTTMLIAILFVSTISIFQNVRSRRSIDAINKIAMSKSRVLRDGKIIIVQLEDIVMNDIFLLEEGDIVPADGEIITSDDLKVNESILTGESLDVEKSKNGNNLMFRGSLVTRGNAYVKTTAIGVCTAIGKIGKSLTEIEIEKTPLQKQILTLVKKMVMVGIVAFLAVVSINYYYFSSTILQSLIQGLTLAMSILPEEIPVALSTFQALASYRLIKQYQVIVKQPKYIETLGAATVICADKTGTITENKMEIAEIYRVKTKSVYNLKGNNLFNSLPDDLIEYAMWSSESKPFDPMEKSIHHLYEKTTLLDKRTHFEKIKEYPLSGKMPFMTHIFKNENKIIIAAKGSPEGILNSTKITPQEKESILKEVSRMAQKGYRVIGIGRCEKTETNWPDNQEDFVFEILGLIAFYDPPKKDIKKVISDIYASGIEFKMITGDFPETASTIADMIGIKNAKIILTGQEVMQMSMEELQQKIKNIHVFARMYPEAKLKAIMALKKNGDIVAMTGDGVNDAPALKASHIGIAMGKKGSDVAKKVAALILMNDNLNQLMESIMIGRKMYDNLRKAVKYIITIHIPIILIVLIPLFLGQHFSNLFLPIHIIYLEIIMGLTCSFVYENEEIEEASKVRSSRNKDLPFIPFKELKYNIILGILITLGCLLSGTLAFHENPSIEYVRTTVFTTLLFANIFLTLTNRSNEKTFLKSLKIKNKYIPVIIGMSVLLNILILHIPFLINHFNLTKIDFSRLITCITVAFIFTVWNEIYKYIKRKSLVIQFYLFI